MRAVPLALIVLIALTAAAQANCGDDMKSVRLKVAQAQQTNPSPQSAAAAKELRQYDNHATSTDEVSCYNTIARVERALRAPAPLNNEPKPGEPVGPVEAITGSSVPPRGDGREF
jgi:predicted component of type VI protein secretion system